MVDRNIEIVEALGNGNVIVRIERSILIPDGRGQSENQVLFALADKDNLVTIKDCNGLCAGVQFFNSYTIDDLGNIIIGVLKSGKEYYKRILSNYDLTEKQCRIIEYDKESKKTNDFVKETCQKCVFLTKDIEDIVPESLSFNYGLIGEDGTLFLYPLFDSLEYSLDDTYRVGRMDNLLRFEYGYYDIRDKQFLTPICFYEAYDFHCKRARVKYEKEFGFIARDKVLNNPYHPDQYAEGLHPQFYSATDFEDGITRVLYSEGKRFYSSAEDYIDVEGTNVRFYEIIKKREQASQLLKKELSKDHK